MGCTGGYRRHRRVYPRAYQRGFSAGPDVAFCPIERQFEIIGEALGQLAKLDAALASQLPDLPQIIAFRNILIYGYAIVDSDRVWRAIHENLPELRESVDQLLVDAPPDGEP
ncbi:MAG TPA: HepT-like ribonuclease domain-containing protein [Dehalococcoidia bacterium]|nr:HepT-like ribonuclease domain-containing protein [Dehalococcoidia bacterium]